MSQWFLAHLQGHTAITITKLQNISSPPPKNAVSPHPHSPLAQGTTEPLFVSMLLPTLGISYTWSHRTHGVLCLASPAMLLRFTVL